MSLERFKTAQSSADAGFAVALAELEAGRKSSHWIWYIFPQLEELGRSSTARFYGIRGLAEACAYLREPVLRERLLQVTRSVAQGLEKGIPVVELMGGSVDAAKLVSSLTLFQLAAGKLGGSDASASYGDLANLAERVLTRTAQQGFPPCEITRARCSQLETPAR